MWIDKNKIESLTQQVESLNQKIKQGETKWKWNKYIQRILKIIVIDN
jgi:hypothetical protein